MTPSLVVRWRCLSNILHSVNCPFFSNWELEPEPKPKPEPPDRSLPLEPEVHLGGNRPTPNLTQTPCISYGVVWCWCGVAEYPVIP